MPPAQSNETWTGSPATTYFKRNGGMIERSNNNTTQEDTAAGMDKMSATHNLAPISPSVNGSPTSTMRPTQSPQFITLPTRTSLKCKKPDNFSGEKWSVIAKDRSEPPRPKKSRRSRRIIIDSSDEESGQDVVLGPRQNAKDSNVLKPRASTLFRRVIIDTSDEESEHQGSLGSCQNPKPSETLKNGGTTSLRNVVRGLASFPTGEVAYGAELADLPLPDIEVLNIGVVRYPYDDSQLDNVKGFAEQLRDKRSGIDWEKIKRTPMWMIPGSALKVQHPEWDEYLKRLTRIAGEHLGFGKRELIPRLRSLYIWEERSVWRNYQNELYDPTRVANLLIILNQAYSGGEIAIGSGDKEVFFNPAAAQHPQFYIASHNRAKHDALPLTSGHRVGLAYDLRLPDVPTPDTKLPSVHDFVASLANAENNLFYDISCWTEALDDGVLPPSRPLLVVLEGTYAPHDMALSHLCAADRAKALAVQAMTRERYGELEVKYKLQAYLAKVTAVVRIGRGRLDQRVTGTVKYRVDRAVGLEGEAEVGGEVWGRGSLGGGCLPLQEGEFESAEVMEGSAKGVARRRTRTCLLLVLQKEDA